MIGAEKRTEHARQAGAFAARVLVQSKFNRLFLRFLRGLCRAYLLIWTRAPPTVNVPCSTPYNPLGATATTAALCTVMFHFFIVTRL
jgi:hypothetical protein